MKTIIALLSVAAGFGLSHASADTVPLLRVRGFNHSVGNPTTDGLNSSNLTTIKGYGANVLRLNIAYNSSFGSFASVWPTMRSKTIQKAQWAQSVGIKLVICFNFSPWDDQGVAYNTTAMWQRSDLVSEYTTLWQNVVNDMAPYTDAIWAYELINEPNYQSYNVTPPQWRNLAVNLITAIHEIQPSAWCIYDVGPLPNSTTLQPIPCLNVIFNQHFYRPGPFCNEDLSVTTPGVGTYKYPSTNSAYVASLGTSTASKATLQAWLQNIENFKTQYNVPLYMGEFSVSAGAQLPDSANWLADVISIAEGWNWNWSYHAFQDANAWNIFNYDSQRKASVFAGFAFNNPSDTDQVNNNADGIPSGYTWCAPENGSVNFSNYADVTFGAQSGFAFLYNVTGNFTFSNATFGGDPKPNVLKDGFYKPSVAPAAPSGLAATVVSSSQINLAWTNNAINQTGFLIQSKIGSGGTYTTLSTVGANVTSVQVTALNSSTNYYFRVCATNPVGNSPFSNEVNATTASGVINVPNFGFEAPVTSTYSYDPSGGSWAFAGNSGVSANNSGFTSKNPAAPQGAQVAFLQKTGTITQAFTGFTPGTVYTVTFSAAQRNIAQAGQTWNVTLDGSVIKSFAPAQSATSYMDYTATFTASTASHSVAFIGTNLNGGDNTVFLDNVRVKH